MISKCNKTRPPYNNNPAFPSNTDTPNNNPSETLKQPTKEEFQLISKQKNTFLAPYASYYSSKELPKSINESPYDIYEDEDTIPTPIKLIERKNEGYKNALRHGFIRSFVCTENRPFVKRHHTFYSSFKDSTLSVSSSHLELLRSVDNNDTHHKKELTTQLKDKGIINTKQKPLFKSNQMVYIKTKLKPCSLNINKKTNSNTNNNNNNNNQLHLHKTPPRFESNYTQTINLTCNTNLNRSIEEINSNSFIIIDDNNFDDINNSSININANNNNHNNNYINPIKNNKLCSIQSPFNTIRHNTEIEQYNNDNNEHNIMTTPSQLGSTSRTTNKNNSTIFKLKSQMIKPIEHTKLNKDKVIDIKVKEVRKKNNQCKQNKNSTFNNNKGKYSYKRNGNKNEGIILSSTSIPYLARNNLKAHPTNINKGGNCGKQKFPIKFDNDNYVTNTYRYKYKNNMNVNNDENIFFKKHSNIFHTLNK